MAKTTVTRAGRSDPDLAYRPKSLSGGKLPEMLRGTCDFEARLTQDNLRAHPAAWFEKHGRETAWAQKRPGVTLWSLDRQQNVAVNLIEIGRFCEAASLPLCGARHTPFSYRTSKKDLANLIKALALMWLVDARPAAAIPITEELLTGLKDRNGVAKVFDDDMLDDIWRRKDFGRRACKTGQEKADKRRNPGQRGFSAQGHPHLWYRDDGDDLGQYRKLQLRVVVANWGLGSERSAWTSPFSRHPNCSSGSKQKGCSMTLDIEAAYCSRDHAMMVTAHPTDPMHEFLARPLSFIDHENLR